MQNGAEKLGYRISSAKKADVTLDVDVCVIYQKLSNLKLRTAENDWFENNQLQVMSHKLRV